MASRWALRVAAILGFLFLYIPIGVIVLYAFNDQRVQAWPIAAYSTRWFDAAIANDSVKGALALSVGIALGATVIALALGSLAAFAVHRFRFFGRETVSFGLALPIALLAGVSQVWQVIVLLFAVGHRIGRYVGCRPLAVGFSMVALGASLVGITMALGG